MTNTKYSLYQEENRLTLVIDNPTEETTAMIMKLMGAGIKDLTGLNPVKQEMETTFVIIFQCPVIINWITECSNSKSAEAVWEK